MFTGRPPKPRFSFARDVEEFWHFVKVNWGNDLELSDKNVKYKEMILMTVTFESSESALHHLDI